VAEYTKNGHKLVHLKDLLFRCEARAAVWPEDAKAPERTENFWLSSLLVFSPSTQGQIVRTLKAWLAVYEDDELVAQVDDLVVQVMGNMPSAKQGTPSTNPQKGQMN